MTSSSSRSSYANCPRIQKVVDVKDEIVQMVYRMQYVWFGESINTKKHKYYPFKLDDSGFLERKLLANALQMDVSSVSYERRVERRRQMKSELECLGDAAKIIQLMNQRIGDTDRGWFYLEQDERKKLIGEISSLAGELMKKSECGELTDEIHNLGRTVFDSARPRRGGRTPWDSLQWWTEEHRQELETSCEVT